MTFVQPEAGFRVQIGKQRFNLSYDDLHSLHAQLSKHIVRELPPEVEIVLQCVCERLAIHRARIMGKERLSAVRWARHLAMNFSKEFTGLSLTDLGHLFNKDHGTIYHAMRKVADAQGQDRILVNELRQVIGKKLQSLSTNNHTTNPIFAAQS